MTPDEFRELLENKTDTELLGPCLRDAILPYVFDADPARWDEFRREVSSELEIAEADISIVGSGRLGFSLRPDNNLKVFSDQSDIDVVVANLGRFDYLLLALLRADYPRRSRPDSRAGWKTTRRNEVYKGWLTPTQIRLDRTVVGAKAQPVLEFTAKWFNTFKRASRLATRRHEDISFRLYRSWEYAELYHLDSLAALRRSLTTQGGPT